MMVTTATSLYNSAKNLYNKTSSKLEVSYTLGPQTGVKMGRLEAALVIAAAKIGTESVTLEKGKLSTETQLLNMKRTDNSKGEKLTPDAKVEVENKIGIKLGGLQYERDLIQEIDKDLGSSNSRVYDKSSVYKGDATVTVTKETYEDGSVKVTGEESYTVGLKLIFGVEAKISTSQEPKSPFKK